MEGMPTGLVYASVPVTAAGLGVEMTPELFGDIRDMEAAALTVWREQAERERQNRGKP